mgnify:CR=1 FL=1
MYLHLGNESIVPTSEIIGIFDIDKCSIKEATKNFLKKAEEELRVTDVSFDLPKSFVVSEYNKKDRVYLSALTPKTLVQRTTLF